LTLKSSTNDAEAQEEMLAALNCASGQEVHRLRFNSRYVQDFLQEVSKAGSPTFALVLTMGNRRASCFCRPEREGYRYVLMPLMLD
jgi:DNA polymerase III sliding clamp (beta) subunit (PCNA family)